MSLHDDENKKKLEIIRGLRMILTKENYYTIILKFSTCHKLPSLDQ
jgi:hypothetical protein